MYHFYQGHLQWPTKATKAVPDTWFRTLVTGVLFFLGQQIAVSLYVAFAKQHLAWFGVVVSLVFGYWLVRAVFKYHHTRDVAPVSYVKHGIGKAVLIGLLSNLWVNGGIWLFHLRAAANHRSSNQATIVSFMHHPSSAVVVTLFAIFLAPAVEEFVFRFLILRPTPYKSRLANVIACLSSLILFTYVHMAASLTAAQHGQLPWANFWFYAGQYALIGGVLVYNFYRHRSLTLNYTIHALWNTYAMAITFLTLNS